MPSKPLFDITEHRATIRLNRPEVHNRIEAEDLQALEDILGQIEKHGGIRVVVLASTGTTFSSGYHLGALDAARQAGDSVPLRFERVANRLEALPVPTVCALQGSVFGGSADLALACDFRIGVPEMELAIPAARLGIHFYRSGIERLVTRVGAAASKRILLTVEKLTAGELIRIGYLDEIVAGAKLEERVGQVADRLASLAPMAIRGMKTAINSLARGSEDAAAIESAIARCLESEDHHEGLKAWAEKRSPRFEGR